MRPCVSSTTVWAPKTFSRRSTPQGGLSISCERRRRTAPGSRTSSVLAKQVVESSSVRSQATNNSVVAELRGTPWELCVFVRKVELVGTNLDLEDQLSVNSSRMESTSTTKEPSQRHHFHSRPSAGAADEDTCTFGGRRRRKGRRGARPQHASASRSTVSL